MLSDHKLVAINLEQTETDKNGITEHIIKGPINLRGINRPRGFIGLPSTIKVKLQKIR